VNGRAVAEVAEADASAVARGGEGVGLNNDFRSSNSLVAKYFNINYY